MIADPGEHGYSESIPTLQIFLQIWHPGTTLSITNAISTPVALLIKLILEAQDQLAATEILLHVMTVSVTEQ